MENRFEHLNHDEVVSVETNTFNNLDISKTFKVGDLLVAIKEYVNANNTNEARLYSKGLTCEVLKLGAQGWKKGKVRLALEFCADEPESLLDDIRQRLKQVEN